MEIIQSTENIIADQLRGHTCVGADAERETRELVDFLGSDPAALQDAVERRLKHEPLGYILGWSPFMGRRFAVTPDVLIPRPATEIIVDQMIETWRDQAVDILEVGTGSGAVAISLALALPQAKVTATDISEPALAIAKQNAADHQATDRVNFIQADLLKSSQLPAPSSQLIVFANLPYIPSTQMAELTPDVRDYEPTGALDGGPDGLDLYRRLFDQLNDYSVAVVAIYLEALPEQLEPLAAEAQSRLGRQNSQIIYADSKKTTQIGLLIQ